MCTRLVVNVSQVYLPMYITETIKLDKVGIEYSIINQKHRIQSHI